MTKDKIEAELFGEEQEENYNKVDEKELFDDENIPDASWHKFKEVGEKVWGRLTKEPYIKKGNEGFKDQYVYELDHVTVVTAKGQRIEHDAIKVGISVEKEFIITRANQANVGDTLGFKFDKEIPSQRKGFSPAKSITPFRLRGGQK